MMLFNELGLSAEILRAVDEQGYREVTPIQQQAIPLILEGRDVLGGAQTGTGKTAGFTLPLLQRLRTSRGRGRERRVRALILTPTRELAAQVGESVREYGRHLPFRTEVIFGGVSIRPQIANLRQGVDIVVATPGRLLDHLQQKTIDLSHIEMFVLDEADRMLDMGFVRDIRTLLKVLPRVRQNLLFSATFSKEIRRLASDLLNAPKEIRVARDNSTADGINQIVHPVDKGLKAQLLAQLIKKGNWRQVLVFTRTKHGANRLAQQLIRYGLDASAIHGNKSQGARTKALAAFKTGRVRVLVATDLAARGLDIERLPHVVNFELPHVPGDYVHRIGRTARAGQQGHAISLVCVDERSLLRDIERLLKTELPQEIIAGFKPDPTIKAEPIQNGRYQVRSQRPNTGRAAKNRAASAAGRSAKRGGSSRRRRWAG